MRRNSSSSLASAKSASSVLYLLAFVGLGLPLNATQVARNRNSHLAESGKYPRLSPTALEKEAKEEAAGIHSQRQRAPKPKMAKDKPAAQAEQV